MESQAGAVLIIAFTVAVWLIASWLEDRTERKAFFRKYRLRGWSDDEIDLAWRRYKQL